MFQVVLWTFGKTIARKPRHRVRQQVTHDVHDAWQQIWNIKKMTRCWVDGGQFYMWIIPDIWKEEYEIANTSEKCQIRTTEYVAFGIMSFGTMKHWGLCRLELCRIGDYVAFSIPSFVLMSLGFMSFGIMSFGILSVNHNKISGI